MNGRAISVLETAGGPAAAFAGMLLAALGADVVRIEPPAGGSFQAAPTAVTDGPTDAYLQRRKRRVALDLRRREGARTFVDLARRADAVIEDLGPGGLGRLDLSPRRLRRANRDLVVVRVAAFGHDGPRAGWQASELVLQGMGGIVHSTGFEGEAGLRVAGLPAHFIAGIHAATAVVAGVLGTRLGAERGAEVRISMEEAYLHHWVRHIQQWAYSGHRMVREARGNGRQGFPHTVPAADGWLYVLALNAGWEEFAAFLGLDEFATHEWSDLNVRWARWDEIEPRYREAIASRARDDWFAAAAKQGYTFAPIHDMLQLASVPQFVERAAFSTLVYDGRPIRVPDLPARARMAEPRPNRVAAPGQDTRAALTEVGLGGEQIERLVRSGVARLEPTGGEQ